MRPSGPHGSGGQNGRKPLQNPTLVERPPDVGLAVHESEVAAHGIHRQPPAHRRDVALDGTAHRLWTWPQRPAAEWAPFQRALERDALTPLAPVLPANTPLAENLRALFRLHSGAIVPITECYPCRARSR